MTEVAIGKSHARDRAAETALVLLVEVETGFERKAFDRGAHGLAADLQRVAGQAQMAHGTGAVELDRARGAEIVKDAARASGAIDAGKREQLASDEPARLIRRHHPGECRHDRRSGRDGSQHKTRKHCKTPTSPSGGPDVSLPAAYHTNRGNIGAAWLVKSEQR